MTIFTIVFNILFAVFTDSQVSISKKEISHINIELESKDIEHEDCKNTESHCAHECLSFHTVIFTQQHFSILNFLVKKDKSSWYYKNLYRPPSFSLASRPPLYS